MANEGNTYKRRLPRIGVITTRSGETYFKDISAHRKFVKFAFSLSGTRFHKPDEEVEKRSKSELNPA
jgi:hypothetical protein